MKHILRRLTRTDLLAAIALVMALGTAMPGTGTVAEGAEGAGSKIVGDAAKRVAAEPAISAEMRYRVDAFGHQLVGTGNYLQFGLEQEKLVRLDLKLQVGDKLATVQEIRGAEAYWVRRDVPPIPATLGYVDLRQLRKSAATANAVAAAGVMPQDDWIMLGGLGRLMAALDQNFAFQEPKADEIQFTAADGKSVVKLPIWTVSGQWKPERLAALTEQEPGKAGGLPEQLPDRVELVLGRTDQVLPLFPYRISYFRTPPVEKNVKEGAVPQPRELLTLELFNVSRKPIDAREFQYQPGDQDVKNLTPYYVQRLTGETKLR